MLFVQKAIIWNDPSHSHRSSMMGLSFTKTTPWQASLVKKAGTISHLNVLLLFSICPSPFLPLTSFFTSVSFSAFIHCPFSWLEHLGLAIVLFRLTQTNRQKKTPHRVPHYWHQAAFLWLYNAIYDSVVLKAFVGAGSPLPAPFTKKIQEISGLQRLPHKTPTVTPHRSPVIGSQSISKYFGLFPTGPPIPCPSLFGFWACAYCWILIFSFLSFTLCFFCFPFALRLQLRYLLSLHPV